jgi:hypothetical protein
MNERGIAAPARPGTPQGAAGWLLLLGLLLLGNALWMLADPMQWYADLPAAVPDTGPFNPHFVRDIGCAFLTIGAGLVWAAFDPPRRYPLTALAALFLASHAALHVFDTVSGHLSHAHWGLDLPGVYLPAAVALALAAAQRRRERSIHAT